MYSFKFIEIIFLRQIKWPYRIFVAPYLLQSVTLIILLKSTIQLHSHSYSEVSTKSIPKLHELIPLRMRLCQKLSLACSSYLCDQCPEYTYTQESSWPMVHGWIVPYKLHRQFGQIKQNLFSSFFFPFFFCYNLAKQHLQCPNRTGL